MCKESLNNEILKNVQNLLDLRFFIPKYQRGYRWKENQIIDLLNDIDRFNPSNDEDKNSWYCLQPLVVKKSEDGWRLIDGQQRLTSIKLILLYLFYTEDKIYTLDYETRGKDEEWLKILEDEKKAENNIDYKHIYTAYQTIKEWFENKGSDYCRCKFSDKILNNCKFIWYDIDQNGQGNEEEENAFIRLNVGKIPLTNSELIKALFLNSSNFAKDKNEEEIRLRQLEISTQWDYIEQELANDEFWHFINGKINKIRPRIEFLFDLIADKTGKEDDKYFTFRHFQTIFEDNNLKNGNKLAFVNSQWESIFNTFLIFKEWFSNKYYYHLIGYLICMDYKDKIKELLDEYREESKDIFYEKLLEKIKTSINWNGEEDICYGDKRAKRILLLHNAITMKNHSDETSRFSFFQYIGTKENKGWDIEHIQARAEKIPESEQHREDWLKEVKSVIVDEDLLKEINNFSNWEDSNSYNQLFEKINEYFSKYLDNEEKDLLSNLTLLDAGTNRGYGNEFYPIKRRKILEQDKNGVFIPICTKKVFLKHYTEDVANMTFWSNEDRKAYLKDIKSVLEPYFSFKN